MARLNARLSTPSQSLSRDQTPEMASELESASPSQTPGASFSSDKENHWTNRAASGSEQRRNVNTQQSTAAPTMFRDDEDDDKRYYDPEQNPEERRRVRQGLRNNARELYDRADEFLNTDGTEIVSLIDRQNLLMNNVKQTADATMDSRFLLNASEITLKKSRRLAFGNNAIGIDIDEFVSKCMTFMRYGRALCSDEDEPATTQARRHRRNAADDEDDDAADGDALDWHVLGERACISTNRRPTVPNFLLGPLSIEKRVRATQRRATQRRDQSTVVSRPEELKEADLEKNESSNLTSQCQRIRILLQQISDDGTARVEAEGSEDMDEEEARALFSRNNLAMNWEVPLLKFAINPHSFAQTIENLFYISFLVKDGFVRVGVDEDTGFPTIRPVEKKTEEQIRNKGAMRHQAILSLDYESWLTFKAALRVDTPLIPNREEESVQVRGRGWYA
ncbi:hypothetical protein, variant [Verruconis gallopava]|uniref:Non-structural maintenance of chromosomes element 4 n=1 Tax=Verruconis gallopava TaxID=253628 RepID=A0A0D2A2P5_9PEZI|nr:hypothetical protein, variant [Verruconis gallopava]KIW00640.1 hypothetical protein, variant [Verruconis gallopava]